MTAPRMGRVLLLIPTTSYKTDDFMDAADRVGVDLVVGTDRRQALESLAPGGTLALDFVRTERALRRIREQHARRPFAAVVGTDDETVMLAAVAAEALGLRHNPPAAVAAGRDKLLARRLFRQAGLRGPEFRLLPLDCDPAAHAREAPYPCVLKPRGLSASRGVLRCDAPASFVETFHRVRTIVETAEERGTPRDGLLLESYLPGPECTVEGLLDGGELQVLALFDKPDPMEGPTFEETLFVTPSRLPGEQIAAVEDQARRACKALALREGPVHIELREVRGDPVVVEVASRTIGGLCARTLRFGAGMGLEEVVLRHALGREVRDLRPARQAAGVSMLPVRSRGVLSAIEGVDRARAVDGVTEVTMTVHRGDALVPLPEGHRYAGFVFAEGATPEAVEATLRDASARVVLRFD